MSLPYGHLLLSKICQIKKKNYPKIHKVIEQEKKNFFFPECKCSEHRRFCVLFLRSNKTIILVWFNLLVVTLTNSFLAYWYQVDILNVITNIAKYFDKNSKKTDFIGDSNPEEDRKKIRDGNSPSTTDNCDDFEEGLESPE